MEHPLEESLIISIAQMISWVFGKSKWHSDLEGIYKL